MYTGGKWVDIPSNGGGAFGINDAGDVVGVDAHGRPFLFSGGEVTYFAGSYGGTGTAINNRGQIVGSSDFGGSFPDEHAFLYTAGQLMDLGTLDGGLSSKANSINNAGQVVGYSIDLDNSMRLAFLYAAGKMTNISFFGEADDINDSGETVGGADLGPFKYCSSHICAEAFLYSAGVMTNLNSFLPEGSDWELTEATAINDKGQIVGYGIRPLGPEGDLLQFAFLLDTTPRTRDSVINGRRTCWSRVDAAKVDAPNHDAAVAGCHP